MKSLITILIPMLFTWGQITTPVSMTGPTFENTHVKVKTVYLYNFSKYIEWPGEYRKGDFIISVFGDNPVMLKELNTMAATKKAGSQNFRITNPKTPGEIEKCHILFVLANSKVNISEIEKAVKGQNTLIITEGHDSWIPGAGINFIVKNDKQLFQISRINIAKYNLQVSPSLTSLAIVID